MPFFKFRKPMIWTLSLVFTFLSLSCATGFRSPEQVMVNAPRHLSQPYLVMISIDGYRPEYTRRFKPQNISKIANEGVQSEGLIPVYPSKTFPNHYSIVTGLYADRHGITSNHFMDPETNRTYKLGDSEAIVDGSWYGGVPLWSLAAQQNMVSATYFWVGSEAEIAGFRPSYFLPYKKDTPHDERVDAVLEWLRLPETKRPHFVGLYFSEVDTMAHEHGTRSKELEASVYEVDRAIGRLMDGLAGLKFPVQVIIVSDHGMQDLDPKKMEYPDQYANFSAFHVVGDGPQMTLYLKQGEDQKQIQKTVDQLNKKAKHFKAYTRASMPSEYHYSRSDRVGDIVLVPRSPYSLKLKDGNKKIPKANHGYPPLKDKNLWGIFYAKGSMFKSGLKLKAFENVHVYPFVAKLLGLNYLPEDIDGTGEPLKDVLTSAP